jgi:hypothetical protein
MKIIIKKLLNEALEKIMTNESEYNYHVSQTPEIKAKPYGSDSIVMMSGRGTGHFGSGLYFSTYNCDEKRNYNDKYGENGSNKPNDEPSMTMVDDKLYRIDFDIYKNLYRVTNGQHAEILFKTLKLSNETLYQFNSSYDDVNKIPQWLGNRYLLLKNNFEKLGIKTPNYKEFVNMIIKASNDYSRYRKGNYEINNALGSSFSTRLMEYGGYNGVNVSGIRGYDNTLHGSVIYDTSKMSNEPKPIKNIGMFCKINNNNVAGDSLSGNKVEDLKYKLLNNKDLYDDDIKLINTLPQKTQLSIMKRYNKFISPYSLSELNDYAKNIYYKTLEYKLINGLIEEIPNKNIIESIVDSNYFKMIYNQNIVIQNSTFLLFVLRMLWRFNDETSQKIINNISRPLTPEEEEQLKEYKEEFN